MRLNPTGNIILADYLYTAAGRLAQTSYGVTTGQPDVRNSFHDNDNDDIYEAYDRFGRIKTHEWEDFNSGTTTIDQFDYTYDYVGNRLSRDIPSSLYSTDDKDQVYTYDELHRLKTFDQGTLSGTTISGTPKSEEDWTLDQLGNWSDFVQKSNGTTTLDQDRLHNDVNEIDNDNDHTNAPSGTITATTGTNWGDPVHDAAGNMTEIPKPSDLANNYDLKYDAWNRLVEVDDGASNVATFEYDGLNRRIQKVDQTGMSDVTSDYYYNTNWQVLEVHKAGEEDEPFEQYVWHPYYIDALAVRYFDSDTDGANIAEHYYCHDANFNVTAIVDDSETVLERYEYTPYGDVNYMNASFTTISPSIENPYLFTGRRLDEETGLYHYRNRYFGAQIGRFFQRDFLNFADGANFYAAYFVQRGTDPTGLEICTQIYERQNDDANEPRYPTALITVRLAANANCETNYKRCPNTRITTGGCRGTIDFHLSYYTRLFSRISSWHEQQMRHQITNEEGDVVYADFLDAAELTTTPGNRAATTYVVGVSLGSVPCTGGELRGTLYVREARQGKIKQRIMYNIVVSNTSFKCGQIDQLSFAVAEVSQGPGTIPVAQVLKPLANRGCIVNRK